MTHAKCEGRSKTDTRTKTIEKVYNNIVLDGRRVRLTKVAEGFKDIRKKGKKNLAQMLIKANAQTTCTVMFGPPQQG